MTLEKRFPFTEPRLKALPTPVSGRPQKDGKLWVFDFGGPRCVPGLCCCITEGGSRTFYWYKKRNGKPVRFRIGTLEEFTVEAARGKAKALNNHDGDPQADRKAARAAAMKESATLGNLWDSYVEHHLKNKKPATLKWCTMVYTAHLAPWADRPLDSITSADVERLKLQIGEMKPSKKKRGPKGGKYIANRVLELISAMFRRRGHAFGLPRGFTPTASVDHYPEHARDRVISVEELARIIAAIDADDNETARDFLRMLLYTGMRRQNVASMAWDNLNIDAGLWRLPGAKTKTGNPLVVTLVPEAMEIIKRRYKENPTDSPYVFPSRNFTPAQVEKIRTLRAEGKTTRQIADTMVISQTAVMHVLSPMFKQRGATHFGGGAKAWQRVLKRAGINSRITLHDVRRTFATAMIERGTPLPVVADAMGHRDLETTMRHYAHANHKAVADATRSTISGLLADVAAAQGQAQTQKGKGAA